MRFRLAFALKELFQVNIVPLAGARSGHVGGGAGRWLPSQVRALLDVCDVAGQVGGRGVDGQLAAGLD